MNDITVCVHKRNAKATITIEVGTNGATTLSRMAFSVHAGHLAEDM